MEGDAHELLLNAYRNTTFVATTPLGAIELRVGKACPTLDTLLGDLPGRTWAYITAFNPGSRRLSDDENEARHRELEERIRTLGLRAYPGEGVADDGAWPPERSLLILDISRSDAIGLGEAFGQRAIVVGELGSPAELIEVWKNSDLRE